MALEMIYRKWRRDTPGSYVIQNHETVVRHVEDEVEILPDYTKYGVEIRTYDTEDDERWTFSTYYVPWAQVLAIYDVPDTNVGED